MRLSRLNPVRWWRRRRARAAALAAAPMSEELRLAALTRLNIGCGYDHREGYLNIDVDPACRPDVLIATPDDIRTLGEGRFEEILAKDVLEHIPRTQTMHALLEWAALLKPGGRLVVETTSIEGLMAKFAAAETVAEQYNLSKMMFGNQQHPGDFHHTAFTLETLTAALTTAGFDVVGQPTMHDGWLWHVDAVKTRNWLDCVEPDVLAAFDKAYRMAFHRPADDIGNQLFGEIWKAHDVRTAVREIFSTDEALYAAGAVIDAAKVTKT